MVGQAPVRGHPAMPNHQAAHYLLSRGLSVLRGAKLVLLLIDVVFWDTHIRVFGTHHSVLRGAECALLLDDVAHREAQCVLLGTYFSQLGGRSVRRG